MKTAEVPARPRARRPGGRSAEVRAAVLAATFEVLLERGMDGVSIGDVAARAGVHETSVYRRWGTKAHLVVDAVLSRTDAQFADPETGTLRGDLSALLNEIAVFVTTPLGRLLLDLAVRQGSPEYGEAREKFRTERFRAGMAVLARAEERGELRPGVDHRLALETLIGPLHVRLLLTHEAIDSAFVESVVDLVLAGIQAPAAETAARAGS
jgi:AcrR family transcriptional regulator